MPPPQLATDYVQQLREQQCLTQELVDAHITSAQQRQTFNYNKNAQAPVAGYCLGDLVWLFNIALKKGLSTKLARPWLGPYVVSAKYSDRNYGVRLPHGGRSKRVHFNRLKRCYRRPSGSVVSENQPPPQDSAATAPTVRQNTSIADRPQVTVILPVVDHYEVDLTSADDLPEEADHPRDRLQRQRRPPIWLRDYELDNNPS